MKSIVIVLLVLGALVAATIGVPVPAERFREVVCNGKGCTFPDKDYGPTVTPYTPTLKPRVRTIIVPPLWSNTTWSDITLVPQENESSTKPGEDVYDDHEDDNAV